MKLLYIDLFCGAGGTSTGVNLARVNGQECARVIACVNHDAKAIASHASNHPDAMHFTEDIRTLEMTPLVEHLKKCRTMNPDAFVVLWASLECTNFSKAKGGQPRDADSRTLAEHLFRYIEAIDPDYIQIENVEEFMSWGDVDENGKPISMDKGKAYCRWIRNVKKYGYDFAHRILNAADFGAYTSRKRFFGIFAKKGLPITFPEPTHAKNPEPGLFGSLQRWKPVKDVLDFSDEGRSIFGREKPLSEKTLERIFAGLVKFVAGGKDKFMVKYNSMNQAGRYQAPSVDEPCPVVATQNRLAVAQVSFLSKQFGGHPESKNCSTDEPAGTITCVDYHAFVTAFYGNGNNRSIDAPAPTLTTKEKLAVVNSVFLDMQYGNGTPASVETAAGTLTANPKHKLVTVQRPWVMNTNFNNVGSDVNEPCPVITANHKFHYLMNPEFGHFAIPILPDDSPMTVKIKQFMVLFGIIDIKMRMLKIPELKLIMGFPEDYVLVGNQTEQTKFIGNAVEVNMARVLCESLYKSLTPLCVTKVAI